MNREGRREGGLVYQPPRGSFSPPLLLILTRASTAAKVERRHVALRDGLAAGACPAHDACRVADDDGVGGDVTRDDGAGADQSVPADVDGGDQNAAGAEGRAVVDQGAVP